MATMNIGLGTTNHAAAITAVMEVAAVICEGLTSLVFITTLFLLQPLVYLQDWCVYSCG